jgi:hypothetical protein
VEAQNSDAVKTSCAVIVPVGQGLDDDARFNQEVCFDVAVTTRSEIEAKGRIGIFGGAVNLGSAGRAERIEAEM